MKEELENRLIELTLDINNLCTGMKYNYLNDNLIKQILRSSTSAALNYGEAQTAESRKDFAHKLSIVLKELKETKVNLKLIIATSTSAQKENANNILDACDHLIAIFYKSVSTVRRSLQ